MTLQLGSTLITLAPVDTAAADGFRAAERRAVASILGFAPDHRPDGEPFSAARPGLHISVSHCHGLAAVAVDPARKTGIDIETLRGSLIRVAPRFLSRYELEYYGTSPVRLLQAWTLKEALLKCSGHLGADLRRDVILPCGSGKSATVDGRPYNIIYSAPISAFGIDAWLSAVTAVPQPPLPPGL